MRWIFTIAAVFMLATLAKAQNERPAADPIRPLPELFEALRTETRPVELIDTYMEYSRVVFDDRDFGPAPPEGFSWEVAERRIAANPALYAPEIQRRLLDLLPEQIEHNEHLAALGGLVDTHQLEALTRLTATLGRADADPILRELWNRCSRLLGEAEPIFDLWHEQWANQKPGPKPSETMMSMYYAMEAFWVGRVVAIRGAETLGSPLFIEDVISTLHHSRERPEDTFYPNFAPIASKYLLPFVEQRPDIYARLLPLADEQEMAKLGDAARNVALELRISDMRRKLIKAGNPPPEP